MGNPTAAISRYWGSDVLWRRCCSSCWQRRFVTDKVNIVINKATVDTNNRWKAAARGWGVSCCYLRHREFITSSANDVTGRCCCCGCWCVHVATAVERRIIVAPPPQPPVGNMNRSSVTRLIFYICILSLTVSFTDYTFRRGQLSLRCSHWSQHFAVTVLIGFSRPLLQHWRQWLEWINLFYPRDVVSAVYATATWLGGWVSVRHTQALYQNG